MHLFYSIYNADNTSELITKKSWLKFVFIKRLRSEIIFRLKEVLFIKWNLIMIFYRYIQKNKIMIPEFLTLPYCNCLKKIRRIIPKKVNSRLREYSFSNNWLYCACDSANFQCNYTIINLSDTVMNDFRIKIKKCSSNSEKGEKCTVH